MWTDSNTHKLGTFLMDRNVLGQNSRGAHLGQGKLSLIGRLPVPFPTSHF